MKLRSNLVCWILLSLSLSGCSANSDWQTASRESAGIAPDPEHNKEAIIQIYGADAWGWRGWFAIHTWVAVKRSEEPVYTVYDVVRWRSRGGGSVVGSRQDIPDRYWYGSRPVLIAEQRGKGVDKLINQIEHAVQNYPWKNEYRVFPGPNSNTFVAWIGAQVPELGLELPFSALGRGYVKQYSSINR